MPETPREQDHLDQARQNESFLDYLIDTVLPSHPRFADWALVVTFYAALHYTKAAILRDHGDFAPHHISRYDQRGDRHVGHNDLVREHLLVVSIYYSDLFDLSQEARYRGYYKTPGDLVAEVRRQRKRLEDIKLACGYNPDTSP